jgi:hypothetical protein
MKSVNVFRFRQWQYSKETTFLQLSEVLKNGENSPINQKSYFENCLG